MNLFTSNSMLWMAEVIGFMAILLMSPTTSNVASASSVNILTVMDQMMTHKIGTHHSHNATFDNVKANELQRLIRQGGALTCNPDTGLAAEGVFDFECKNMDLLSILTGPELGSGRFESFETDTWLNDVWGWIDEEDEGKEYALVGMWDGTSFVDISNPRNPKVVGFLDSTFIHPNATDGRATWRDVKVVGNVAYIGAEIHGHGIQVFDLIRLRALPRAGQITHLEADNLMTEVGKTHNVVAAPAAGKVLGVGFSRDPTEPLCHNSSIASLAIFDVSTDPLNPTFESCYHDVEVGYVHDAHCIKYQGPDVRYTNKNICALFAGNKIVIIDLDLAIDDPTAAIINSFVYPNFGYVHQGWFSEDHSTLYVDDETDELYDRVHETTTIIVDMTDLQNSDPLVGTFENNVDTEDYIHPNVDHNLYIRGDFLYQASYTAGARIRRIVEQFVLQEVAFFDMEQSCEALPVYDSVNHILDFSCDPFAGSWTYYPYFDSGITIASSTFQGLFLLQPQLV